MSRESFLSRWSRRKLNAGDEPPVESALRVKQTARQILEAKPEATVGRQLPETTPELPPVDSVSLDTGVAAFFRPDVEEGLRRQALKKLFSDSHFNTMDGLDVYIDDYSKPDPIPAAMLERLVRTQTRSRDTDAEGGNKTDISQPDTPANSRVAAAPKPGTEDSGQEEDSRAFSDGDLPNR